MRIRQIAFFEFDFSTCSPLRPTPGLARSAEIFSILFCRDALVLGVGFGDSGIVGHGPCHVIIFAALETRFSTNAESKFQRPSAGINWCGGSYTLVEDDGDDFGISCRDQHRQEDG